MQCTCINNRCSIFIATKDNHQIAYHSCSLLIVKFYNILIGQLIKSHLNHRYSTFNNLKSC